MSKILEAMRKSTVEERPDYAFQLATIDGASLYPTPSAKQKAEFELLANSLLSRSDGTSGQVVVFASTVSGEGASYVSYGVARHLSFMLDRRVAWIDANFRSPQAKLPPDELSFRALLQNPALFSGLRAPGNLVLVSNGDIPIKTTDLLSSDNYGVLLDHFQRSFQFTIIDAPPILESVDTAHLAAPTSGLILVVEAKRLKHEVIKHGLEGLAAQKVRIIGSVLNRRTFDIPGFIYKRL